VIDEFYDIDASRKKVTNNTSIWKWNSKGIARGALDVSIWPGEQSAVSLNTIDRFSDRGEDHVEVIGGPGKKRKRTTCAGCRN
jgi:hypothetical protein